MERNEFNGSTEDKQDQNADNLPNQTPESSEDNSEKDYIGELHLAPKTPNQQRREELRRLIKINPLTEARDGIKLFKDKVSERAPEAYRKSKEVGRQARKVTSNAVTYTDQALNKSRQNRLTTRDINRERRRKNPIRTFFRTKVGKWVIRPIAEMSPIVGDGIKFYGAARGTDLLTGDRLDVVDRVIYFTAAALPGVPATLGVVVIGGVRLAVEELAHGIRSKDPIIAVKSSVELYGGSREVAQLLKVAIKKTLSYF